MNLRCGAKNSSRGVDKSGQKEAIVQTWSATKKKKKKKKNLKKKKKKKKIKKGNFFIKKKKTGR